MSKKVGVLLSGCGFLDGSEIHEAVLTMLHLDRAGAQIVAIAPRGPQAGVMNHATHEPMPGARRDILEESARIARGKIRELAEVRARDLDALILPGGFGAAKNLSDFATKGAAAKVHPEVARLLGEMLDARKPIGAVCIAPATLAAAAKQKGVHPTLTIGDDKSTAAALVQLGAKHEACPVTGFVVDEANKIVSTPAYMYDARISEVDQGIGKLVQAVLGMA